MHLSLETLTIPWGISHRKKATGDNARETGDTFTGQTPPTK